MQIVIKLHGLLIDPSCQVAVVSSLVQHLLFYAVTIKRVFQGYFGELFLSLSKLFERFEYVLQTSSSLAQMLLFLSYILGVKKLMPWFLNVAFELKVVLRKIVYQVVIDIQQVKKTIMPDECLFAVPNLFEEQSEP